MNMLTVQMLTAFCNTYETFLESLDQNTYDIAVRLGIRCLLHHVLVRNKDPSNVLQNVLSFRDEDTLLADGEFCEYAKIICYTSPNESGTLPLYKVRMIDSLAEIYFHYTDSSRTQGRC